MHKNALAVSIEAVPVHKTIVVLCSHLCYLLWQTGNLKFAILRALFDGLQIFFEIPLSRNVSMSFEITIMSLNFVPRGLVGALPLKNFLATDKFIVIKHERLIISSIVCDETVIG